MGRKKNDNLTQKQYALYLFIKKFISKKGYAPKYIEMQLAFGKSKGAIQGLLNSIERKKYIESGFGIYRGIKILK